MAAQTPLKLGATRFKQNALSNLVVRVQFAIHFAVSFFGYGLANYRNTPLRVKLMRTVRRLKRARPTIMTPLDMCQLYAVVEATRKLPGEMAEVGVAYGGSARMICEVRPDRTLHLFDTFQGLPDPGEVDVDFHQGDFTCSEDSVRDYLRDCDVVLYPGLFPGTAMALAESGTKFSFVHLDVDLYQSTLDALRFFYGSMVSGGVIVSHDYVLAAGPRLAFDEFFSDKPEPVIELTGNQCMVVKTGSV